MKRTTEWYMQEAANILRQINYAAVATVTASGRPWCTPVYAWHDDQARIYWVSDRESRHSQNVRRTGQAFIVLFDSTFALDLPSGSRRGVYLQALVREVDSPKAIAAALRHEKPERRGRMQPAHMLAPSVRRLYCATPLRAWMNDVQKKQGVFIRDFRVELPLPEIRSRLLY